MLLSKCGHIVLDPSEYQILAKALDLLSSEYEQEAGSEFMLRVDTMATVFELLALVTAYEFQLTPADEEAARTWVNSLIPKEVSDDQDR